MTEIIAFALKIVYVILKNRHNPQVAAERAAAIAIKQMEANLGRAKKAMDEKDEAALAESIRDLLRRRSELRLSDARRGRLDS